MENLGINYSFKKHTYSIQRVIPDQSNRELKCSKTNAL